MRNVIRFMVPIVAGLLVFAGCSKKPVEEIGAADQALQAAMSAEAREYAPQSLAAAQDAKAQLEAEVQAQDKKFALLRNYDKASEFAASMKVAAEKAAADAAAAKEAAKNESTNLIAQAKTTLEETRAFLAKAPRGKGSEVDIKAMEADLSEIEKAILDAEAAFAQGQYLSAKAKAKASIQNAESIKNSIQAAIDAKKKARG